MSPEKRKEQILKQSIKVACKYGYSNVTREKIIGPLKISQGLIIFYFKSMGNLKKEIMQTAIEREILDIIIQGIGVRDPYALGISKKLKRKIIKRILLT